MLFTAPGSTIARQALTGGYIGIPYNQLDCQAFVEKVLYDAGIRKEDGNPYNWRGSNSMWRHYVKWKGTIQECMDTYGEIPLGSFLFIVKFDGGEKDRGYHDDQGNATHVGLYVSEDSPQAMDSQPTGGVQRRKLSVFNRVALMSMINYSDMDPSPDPVNPYDQALRAVHLLRTSSTSDKDYLDALQYLSDYLS